MPRRRAEKKRSCSQREQCRETVICPGGTPAASRTARLAARKSICALPVDALRSTMACKSKRAFSNSATTSSPTSKQPWQMLGPIAAWRRSARAPWRHISFTTAAAMRPTVPRQPAWATAMTPACSSTRTIGTQSAVFTPITTPRRVVTSASTPSSAVSCLSMSSERKNSSMTATRHEWVCRGMIRSSRSTPSCIASVMRASSTRKASSPT